MNEKWAIVVKTIAKPDQIDYVKNELMGIIEPIRNERGCLQFDLHVDVQNPMIHTIYEVWENKTLWQEHLNSSHMIKHSQMVSTLFEEYSVDFLHPIEY